ncbi:putative cadmium/zinc-transporting ATPase HMA4 [Bienertia sinuspersici]
MLIAVIGTIVLKDYLEAGTIVFLFTIAEWLESRASQKATAVMSSILSMTPQQATIADTGEVVNVKDVKLNTILAVKAGELIPIDGIVVHGTCEVDEKTLTGESFPVPKQKDSNVWAGTVNVNGYVSVKTAALAEDCAVAKMARLVEEAQNNKSSVQRLIDRCAKYYTPAVVLISAGVAVVPIALKLHNRSNWFHLALVVLVSACPCGLILSTPVATFCALSRAATSGLLIKGGDYLEILAKIKYMAFDKTGTITRGEFTLTDFRSLADDIPLTTLLYWLSSIESKSSHPIAAVLVDYGRGQGVEPKPENVEDFQNFPGEGVFGKMDGKEIYIGNKKLGQRANCTVDPKIVNGENNTKEARTCGYIYSGGALIGSFSLSDDCRSGAAEAIKELKSMGIRTALLTGDSQSTAMRAQEQLGKGLDAVHAELLPEDKARIIADYKKDGPTAMVGDGVNDAPALATADVGISMGVSGSALATETGHVILMSNDIRKIPKAIKLARKTHRKVIENLIFSVATKAGVIAVAVTGHPLIWLAVLVDVFTCLTVIFNSMLLLRGSGQTHGSSSRCCGVFSWCHSHKTKHHHSKTNQQCCSKKAVPNNCSGTPCHKTEPKSCGSTRCSSQNHSAPPCQTTSPKSCGATRCSSKSSLAATPCQTTATCHSSVSHVGDSTVGVQQKQIPESTKCCQTTHQHIFHADAHDTDEKHCHFHDCASELESDNLHSSNTCEDHYLDLLESQTSPCHIKGENLEEGITCCKSAKCDSLELQEIQTCEQKSSCCEGNDGNTSNCQGQEQKTVPLKCSSVIEELNHEHCKSSHDSHVEHDHHHDHQVLAHETCHANTVAKHACHSLRKREVGACCKSFRRECCSGSQGHIGPAFGGLTEIVTE